MEDAGSRTRRRPPAAFSKTRADTGNAAPALLAPRLIEATSGRVAARCNRQCSVLNTCRRATWRAIASAKLTDERLYAAQVAALEARHECIAFVCSGVVVIVNVFFKRMEVMGKKARARRIDNFTLWIYPATLASIVLICWYWFMVRQPLA